MASQPGFNRADIRSNAKVLTSIEKRYHKWGDKLVDDDRDTRANAQLWLLFSARTNLSPFTKDFRGEERSMSL